MSELGMAYYDPCPTHPGHSFHRSTGYCSCGAGHRELKRGYYAGDIEPGDRILDGQVLPVSTGMGGFYQEVVRPTQTVVDVTPSEYASERVLVRTVMGTVFDLHRTNLVRLITKEKP